jgi:hypothetical protein
MVITAPGLFSRMTRQPSLSDSAGKIERWHQTLKNRVLLENYYLPGDLEASICRFVDHYSRLAIDLSNCTRRALTKGE